MRSTRGSFGRFARLGVRCIFGRRLVSAEANVEEQFKTNTNNKPRLIIAESRALSMPTIDHRIGEDIGRLIDFSTSTVARCLLTNHVSKALSFSAQAAGLSWTFLTATSVLSYVSNVAGKNQLAVSERLSIDLSLLRPATSLRKC